MSVNLPDCDTRTVPRMSQYLVGSSCWLFSIFWRQNAQVTILSWGFVGIPSSKLRWRAGKSPCSLVINSGKPTTGTTWKMPSWKKGKPRPKQSSSSGSSRYLVFGVLVLGDVYLHMKCSLKAHSPWNAMRFRPKKIGQGWIYGAKPMLSTSSLPLKNGWFFLCLFKVILFNFYYGKSPINHHLGEYCLFCPTTSSKSKFWCSLLKNENGERRKTNWSHGLVWGSDSILFGTSSFRIQRDFFRLSKLCFFWFFESCFGLLE